MGNRRWLIGSHAAIEFAKKDAVLECIEEMRYLIDSLFCVVQNENAIISEGDLMDSSSQLMRLGEMWEYIDNVLAEVFAYAVSNELTDTDE